MKRNFLMAGLLLAGISLSAQYRFTIETDLPATPVKDQHRTGTCWSHAATSFLESELIRMGKGEHDLSEMYFVRKAYELKAERYVRLQGKTNFGEGGLAMDVMHIIAHTGMVPQEAYAGHVAGGPLPVHGEMDGQLKAYVEAIIKNRNGSLSPAWKQGFSGILDAYLGQEPEHFQAGGSDFTARTYADAMGINPGDYVAIGSYTHHPFYQPFALEVPDNWLWSSIYNLPLDEMLGVLNHALEQGYTAVWDGDVRSTGYSHQAGLATLPVYDADELSESRRAEWDGLDKRQKRRQFYDFFSPGMEVSVDQEKRQEWFDNYTTMDIHLQHVTGLARDQDGKRFYRVKNSYGNEDHIYDGYQYFSENYMRGKTIFLLLHRDALPADLAGKLGL
jgi:bleomycin hydrolase